MELGDFAWSIPLQAGRFIGFVDDCWASLLAILRAACFSFFFWAALEVSFSWLLESLPADLVVENVEGSEVVKAYKHLSLLSSAICCSVNMIQ